MSCAKNFPEYPEFNPLMFSVDVFVPLFLLHQEASWYPEVGSEDFAIDILRPIALTAIVMDVLLIFGVILCFGTVTIFFPR